jgi:cysteine-rich repeat protein
MRSSLVRVFGSVVVPSWRVALVPVALGLFGLAGCSGGTTTILQEKCGNGRLEEDNGEECEDGNTKAGDGCFECKQEDGYDCSAPFHCVPHCGDGMVVGDEVCDGEPYCLEHCSVLVDGSCTDGIVQEEAGEECDLPDERYPQLGAGGAGGESNEGGIRLASPGCDAECRVKFGYRCESNQCGQIDAPKTDKVDARHREVCEWMIELLGGVGSKNYCTVAGTSYVFTTNDVETCVTSTKSAPSCTIADIEAWGASGDVCNLLTGSPECF